MRTTFTIAVALVLSLATWMAAGEFNKTLSVGDVAPAFEKLVGIDERSHALADFDGKPVALVVFTCNTCPYATDIDARLVDLAKRYADAGDKLAVIAINPNKVNGDKLPDMKKRAESAGFVFPYLWDETQETAKAYGASYTPECFVLGTAIEGKRKIVYQGAFDDSPDGKNVRKKYVEQAVAAALAGKSPDTTETQSIGCAVRYEKSKRKK